MLVLLKGRRLFLAIGLFLWICPGSYIPLFLNSLAEENHRLPLWVYLGIMAVLATALYRTNREIERREVEGVDEE